MVRRITGVLLLLLVSIGASIGLGTAIAGAAPACGSACYVNGSSGSDANAGTVGAPLATIQAALNAVSSGGTVYVAAGTYDENVSITQPVTLDGANAGVPTTGATRGAESIISTSNAGNDYTVDISAPNVTVDGFTLQQTAPVTCSACAAFGVQVEPAASGAVVTNNIITGMETTGSNPGTQAGNPIGVDVGADSSTSPRRGDRLPEPDREHQLGRDPAPLGAGHRGG